MQNTALIVEDSKTQAELIGRMIAREQWRIVICHEMKAAYNLLKMEPVQLMLVDMYLAEETTLPHIPILRKMAPATPIAVMTAGNRHDDVEKVLEQARKAQADFVMKKPFTADEIHNMLTAALIEFRKGGRRIHALVIDDCRFVRHMVVDVLDKSGYRVSEAKTMEEALKNINIANVDLIVTDIFMPGMGGIEGIRRIRASWPRVKIIAMSAGLEEKMTSDKALMAARFVGADGQLNKPFLPENLLGLADDILSQAAA